MNVIWRAKNTANSDEKTTTTLETLSSFQKYFHHLAVHISAAHKQTTTSTQTQCRARVCVCVCRSLTFKVRGKIYNCHMKDFRPCFSGVKMKNDQIHALLALDGNSSPMIYTCRYSRTSYDVYAYGSKCNTYVVCCEDATKNNGHRGGETTIRPNRTGNLLFEFQLLAKECKMIFSAISEFMKCCCLLSDSRALPLPLSHTEFDKFCPEISMWCVWA